MKALGRTIIVLAAGGTGGHMFPAEALAKELATRGFSLALVTDKRGAAFGEGAGVEVHRIRASQMVGGTFRKAAAAIELGRGYFDARRILRELEPAAAVGFGGYAALPTMVAAVRAPIPTLIHEQNAVLGRANRYLAPRVDAIATSFEEVYRLPHRVSAHLRRTGNPVRPEIAALSQKPYPAPQKDGQLNILITGGSQGATVFSKIVPIAVSLMPPELRARLRIAQQVRPEDRDAVITAYKELSVASEVRVFFNNMPELLAQVHLVIGRSGASTVAEITAAGRPAILVPYPAAMDDHQLANAQALMRKKCAWAVAQNAFTPEKLKEMLTAMLANPAPLIDTAARSRAVGHPDAASKLADMVVELTAHGGAHMLSRHPTQRRAAG